jgi:serine/threonine protein kinase
MTVMTTAAACFLLVSLTVFTSWTNAFVPQQPLPTRHDSSGTRRCTTTTTTTTSANTCIVLLYNNNGNGNNNNGWTSDFDDYFPVDIDNNNDDDESSSSEEDEEEDPFRLSNILQQATTTTIMKDDLSACQVRQFSLGQDFVVTDFAGSMGFDEVTDWEYYYDDVESEEDGSSSSPSSLKERKVVSPPPLDPSKPRRTRQQSGSIIRIFRGTFEGRLGATLRSQGLDRRILIKEFSGKFALQLAQSEVRAISKLQSDLMLLLYYQSDDENAKKGDWVQTVMARSALPRKDDANLAKLLQLVSKAPFCGILGEVNLAELEDDDDDVGPNDFYRALGVSPPKPGSIWIVYEYTGLSTVASYSLPASVRISQMPPRRGPFGNVIAPPALPSFKERSRYVIHGIIKGALEAVALLHESDIVHGSIGRSSVLLSSVGQDKTEASSPYATNASRLVVKLADLGFSKGLEQVTSDPAFLARAKSFGLVFARDGESSSITRGYAVAEDLHALGFVVLSLLLTSLAQVPPTLEYKLPDEDTLQRLLTDIFEKDVEQFRAYVQAEDVWSDLVALLDEKEGWKFLESLLFARERVADEQQRELPTTARGLLSSPFFQR